MISISGLDKAGVLAALYNGTKSQGVGLLHFTPKDMTVEQAQEILDEREAHAKNYGTDASSYYFDYLNGRVMKVDLGGDEIDTWGYDRDNGEGAAELAILHLLEPSDLVT